MATDYDTIASDYAKTKANPIKAYSEAYTFFQLLGDVRGQAVLDLACGDGDYTRAIRRRGAQPVWGVDLSPEMIRVARQAEQEAPLGITYQVSDVCTLEKVGAFDLVTAVYLLQYAGSRSQLRQMAAAIARNMKPDGRFVTVTGQPDLTPEHLQAQAAYGALIEPQGPLTDGAIIQTTLTTPGGPVQFRNRHWCKATLEAAFRRAGFQVLTWHPMQVSPAGYEAYGPAYWRPFEQYPAIVALTGTLAG